MKEIKNNNRITTDGINYFTTKEPEEKGKILQIDAKTNKITEINMEEVIQKIITKQGVLPNCTQAYDATDKFSNKDIDNENSRLGSLIRATDPTYIPYIKVCRVSWNGGSGSGYMVARNVVLTAAHCFLDNKGNVLPEWTCAPAYNYGIYDNLSSGWQQGIWGSNWISTHSASEDWCIVVLDWNMGDRVGWFGCQSYGSNSEMNQIYVHSIGYPGSPENAQYPYYSPGNILNTYNGYFDMSATPRKGMSGGPIIRWSDDVAIGINHGFYDDSVQDGIGCRINQEIINIILSHQ